mmetsp:Transcript_8170/g.23349  ORF Transcript_8170/g.23349 Transcript_8170/m.23349 type:complete len:237 (-) Transcript_8170:268-978(-)
MWKFRSSAQYPMKAPTSSASLGLAQTHPRDSTLPAHSGSSTISVRGKCLRLSSVIAWTYTSGRSPFRLTGLQSAITKETRPPTLIASRAKMGRSYRTLGYMTTRKTSSPSFLLPISRWSLLKRDVWYSLFSRRMSLGASTRSASDAAWGWIVGYAKKSGPVVPLRSKSNPARQTTSTTFVRSWKASLRSGRSLCVRSFTVAPRSRARLALRSPAERPAYLLSATEPTILPISSCKT